MKLVIIVPCYNEEDVLPETNSQLSKVIEKLRRFYDIDEVMIVYVDDGSSDHTWEKITLYASRYPYVFGLKLAHNAGHQYALWAGLEWSVRVADAIITIDADLQDDVEAIFQMVNCFLNGNDIVYGVRRERNTDSVFKKYTAQCFYKLMKKMGGDIVYNHADFRLMSRRAVVTLLSYPERNVFLRGLVCTLGYPSTCVYYDRKERYAGSSKYPLKKMVSFAIEGITSFSVRPLQYITYSGIFFILISIGAIFYGICSYLKGWAIPGWTSLLVSIWFIGGAILLACGIIGTYIGKIYKEVKKRPRYIIEKDIAQKGKTYRNC